MSSRACEADTVGSRSVKRSAQTPYYVVQGKTDESLVRQSLLYRSRELRDSPSLIFMEILSRFTSASLSLGCDKLPQARLMINHVTHIVDL